MCYTTGGVRDEPLSTYEPVGPTFSDPSHYASDPATRSILAGRGFQLTPGTNTGFRATSGSGVPFVPRGLLQSFGNGTGGVSQLKRVSPIAQAITQPFTSADTPIRSVR